MQHNYPCIVTDTIDLMWSARSHTQSAFPNSLKKVVLSDVGESTGPLIHMSLRKIWLLLCLIPGGLAAEGDPINGESLFISRCTACHVIVNHDGHVFAGRTARTGPNLFGITARPVGTADGFRYSQALLEVSTTGAMWTQDTFARYAQNPTNWLRDVLQNRRARSKMAYRLHDESDAMDIFAFLQQFE